MADTETLHANESRQGSSPRLLRTLDSAINYADIGFKVIPLWSVDGEGRCLCGRADCSSPGKHPHGGLAPKGSHNATQDGVTIANWGNLVEDLNIGICAGATSGVVVLDVDPAHGGSESLARIESIHGKVKTLEVLTGGGGRHLYFKFPTGQHVKNSVGKLGPGLDVRSDGGYVVAPPSLHASGNEYRWRVDPRAIEPAECPKWLTEAHEATVASATEASNACDSEVIGEGRRNATLTSMAGAMRRKGFGEDAIRAALVETNRSRCKPPLDDTEVAQIAERIARYATENLGDDDESGKEGHRKSQSTMLVGLAEEAYLFHNREGEAFAAVSAGGHSEIWRVRSAGFRRWLTGQFWKHHQKAPGSQAMQDALGVLMSKALYEGDEWAVHVRLGEYHGDIWLDLGNAAWQAIRISADGWEVSDAPAVKFLRPRGLLALPTPERGGDVHLLRQFLNLESDGDWMLVLSWLVAALRPTGPYPLLVVNGEQGSAKTTLCRILRSLLDPNVAGLRAVPRDVRDLMIAASNSWILGYDNLSGIPLWLSDALCRLATGGGFATRELYSDSEEVLIDVQRPVIINGIEDLATRSDLLDRAVGLTLPTIPDQKRRTEAELWRSIGQLQPRILGAILDAVCSAMRNVPSVRLANPPRMADFAAWSVAAEPGLGLSRGAFLAAYTDNRQNSNSLAIEASVVGLAIQEFTREQLRWEGTAQQLLAKLEERSTAEQFKTRRDWPATPQSLGTKLHRLAPNLRRSGVNVQFARAGGKQRTRIIALEWTDNVPSEMSDPSGTRPNGLDCGCDEDKADISDKTAQSDSRSIDAIRPDRKNT